VFYLQYIQLTVSIYNIFNSHFPFTILRNGSWVSACPGHHQERGCSARPIGRFLLRYAPHKSYSSALSSRRQRKRPFGSSALKAVGRICPHTASTHPPCPTVDQGNYPLVHPPGQAVGGTESILKKTDSFRKDLPWPRSEVRPGPAAPLSRADRGS
jgi:hypothetical protein